MMESSEQCAYDGSLDPDDSSSGTERIVVASYEDYTRVNEGDDDQGSEQVVGYLDEENATIVLQSQGIELDGKRLILAQGTGGDEIIVFVSSEQDPSIEHTLEHSISENSDDNHTLAIQCGSNNLEAISSDGTQGIEVIGTNDALQNIDKNGTVYVEQAHELTYVDSENNHYSSEALSYHVQEKDDTTEMVFIPTTSQVISTGNNTRLLHLADVAHSEWATSELHEKEDIECTRKISEGSVIVSQIHADSDFHSSKVEDVSINIVNEQDNNNNFHDEHMTSEIEASSSAVEENSSILSLPSRDIDNAVSVIHVTSSTLVHDQDWRTKNIQENEDQTEETNQSDTALPAVSTNAIKLDSNLKETLDSELSSQSPLIKESSNHSHSKDTADSSSKDNTANYETTAAVEEPMDEDTSESIRFPPQLPSSENLDEDDSKQKDSIICHDNNSNNSMDIDQGQNVENDISDPSSKNCENEMDFTNSEEACSEIEAPERTFLSLRENSETKCSFFSDNSQSKDHNLHKAKKLKTVSPSKVKKVIDEYEFENSSSNLDQEFSHNSSLDGQPSDMVNSDDISTEVDATKVSQSVNSDVESVTGNLTFQGALTTVTDNIKLDENLTDCKNTETYFDSSQDLFDRGSLEEEEQSSSRMLKNTNEKCFKNNQNSVSSEINHIDQDKKSDDKILAVKNGVTIDNKSKESDSAVSDVAVSNEITASVETTVKPPQRTYIRKRKSSVSERNIELFSLDDDLSDPKDETSSYLTPKIFGSDDQMEQNMNDEDNMPDEDGYVNLLPSDVNNRIKAKGTSPPGDERRTRSLRLRSSDHPEKISDPIMDAEDSVSTCWGAYLMETSFKPTNTDKTEGDAPKVSSLDVQKEESIKSPLKKRTRTPSFKKLSVKNDSNKSGREWDKLIKSSPTKLKDASSHKRKIREKVKKQVEKTLRNSENFNSSPISIRKKGRPSKDLKRNKIILPSSFSSPEKVKTCGIRFLNDNSIEKNNSSAIDELCAPSTSSQDLKSFQYTCSNCNFVSNKVNNLIIHLKYCKEVKASADRINYPVDNMDLRQRIRGDTESYPAVGQSSTSQNFSNGSLNDDDDNEMECSSPSQEGLSQENGDECEKDDDDYNEEEEQSQNSIDNKKKFGYSENDIVWASIHNRFWPALVHKINDKEFVIYFIDRPSAKGTGVTNVRMNVSIDAVPEQLHSFNDPKWTKKMLAEAAKLPDNDLFFKAVQKSDTYTRRRCLYEKDINGFTFFDIHKNSQSHEDGDNLIEENLDMIDDVEEESVDIKELMECIFEENCNKHVLDVYNEVVPSQRHELHSQKEERPEAANQLKHMSWFGPFKNHSQMQIRLHDFFIDLFKKNFGPRKDMISYIYEVWIPEGIIKAISLVKRISLLEAQIIFYKQDMSCVDVEDFLLDDDDS